MMRVRDTVTSPGGARANEDRVGFAGTLAWVIDGATDLYADAALPAGNDVLWLVDVVAQRLGHAGAEGYRGDGSDLLGAISRHVADQMTAHSVPAGRVPPACSLVVSVDRGRTFEITRVPRSC